MDILYFSSSSEKPTVFRISLETWDKVVLCGKSHELETLRPCELMTEGLSFRNSGRATTRQPYRKEVDPFQLAVAALKSWSLRGPPCQQVASEMPPKCPSSHSHTTFLSSPYSSANDHHHSTGEQPATQFRGDDSGRSTNSRWNVSFLSPLRTSILSSSQQNHFLPCASSPS